MQLYRIRSINCPLDYDDTYLKRRAARELGVRPDDLVFMAPERRSVDARDKRDIRIVVTLIVGLDHPAGVTSAGNRTGAGAPGRVSAGSSAPGGGSRGGAGFIGSPGGKATPVEAPVEYRFADMVHAMATGRGPAYNRDGAPPGSTSPGSVPDAGHTALPAADLSGRPDEPRPVVVGAGPAGLFCALQLAEAGLRPILLERGAQVGQRDASISAFWSGQPLDPESNMQFGEGGAGTYSDGKLATSTGDSAGRQQAVLRAFVAAGAPGHIVWDAKPHVGTNLLRGVVSSLRKRIERSGGDVRFHTRMDGLVVTDGTVTGVRVSSGETIPASALVLAIGHSARDTFAMLAAAGVPMERKPFAMGLRIEHPQEMISRSQYGNFWNHPALGAADYKLTHRAPDGRGVYSFCMCPGGYVVDASSEPGLSVCNGMSDNARDAANANSAIVVTVRPEDFGGPGTDILAGVEFQRHWERLARQAALAGRKGQAGTIVPSGDKEAARTAAGSMPAAGTDTGSAMPIQLLGDFIAGTASTRTGSISPSLRGSWSMTDLHRCVPGYVADGIAGAMAAFDRTIPGFGRADAVLTGVETRTSSPVRILRGDDGSSPVRGLFPAGEGAGYAGGIMSAAVDGIRAAESLAIYLLGRRGRGEL